MDAAHFKTSNEEWKNYANIFQATFNLQNIINVSHLNKTPTNTTAL
jgi:hypothetical protein